MTTNEYEEAWSMTIGELIEELAEPVLDWDRIVERVALIRVLLLVQNLWQARNLPQNGGERE